jgi:hypothetical protein
MLQDIQSENGVEKAPDAGFSIRIEETKEI